MPPGWNHIDGGKMAASYRTEAWKEYKTNNPQINEI
jgi:hypothetical protein